MDYLYFFISIVFLVFLNYSGLKFRFDYHIIGGLVSMLYLAVYYAFFNICYKNIIYIICMIGNIEISLIWQKVIVEALLIVSFLLFDLYIFVKKDRSIADIENFQVVKISLLLLVYIYVMNMLRCEVERNVLFRADEYLLLYLIVIIFMISHVYNALYMVVQQREIEEQYSYIEQIADYQKSQLLYQEKYLKDTFKFRHDIKNHMRTIGFIAQKNNCSEIEKYINDLYGEFNVCADFINTGNELTDAIFNHYSAMVENEGGRIVFKGSFPSEMSLDSSDIVVLITNLLQNSYNEMLKNVDKKEIIVSIKYDEEQLFIMIENEYSDSHFNKKNIEHGYGLKKVRKVVEKKKGIYNIKRFEDDGVKKYRTTIAMRY